MPTKANNMRVLMTQHVPTPAIDRLRDAVASAGEGGVLDINPEYIKGVNFHYVKTLNQVIDLALMN